MPQASKSLRAEWNGDHEAQTFLIRRGFFHGPNYTWQRAFAMRGTPHLGRNREMAKLGYRIWVGRDTVTGIVYAVTAAAARWSCVERIRENAFTDSVKPVRFKMVPANRRDVFTLSPPKKRITKQN